MPDGNLLRNASSPYLLQHAGNPVHWQQWGAAALAEAAREKKPILLSIGYAACHWCHVMAHESFEDPATAELMNREFVAIKVDREERPDVDHLYMSALQAMGEQGGWPLTMFLTPDGAPFWGGTYFPPEPRFGRPAFRQVLEAIAAAWRKDPAHIASSARELVAQLTTLSRGKPGAFPEAETRARVAAAVLAATDPEEGGFRGAPKFPTPSLFRFLWQESFRGAGKAAGSPFGPPNGSPARDAVRLLLRRMSMGGIYDHLGGGYARYATDAHWLVPHFEKMLYDNAQILELLGLAFAARAEPLFAARAAETVAWLVREMRAGEAFAASQDADSEGKEGKFYVWDEAEIDAVLAAVPGGAADEFKRAYGVVAGGNWEGRTILHRVIPLADPATEARLAAAREALYAARAKRVPPARDDKVLADWNGLAIAALARAGVVFGEPTWIGLAEEAFAFVLETFSGPDHRVAHAWRRGKVSAAGLLDDQAAMARAALQLFETTGEPKRLEAALRLVAVAEERFAAPAGGFFSAADDARDLPFGLAGRAMVAEDNAAPSGNGMMAEVYARLFHATGDGAYRVKAERVIGAFTGNAAALGGMPVLLGAADVLESGASVVITGRRPDLVRAALAAPDPAVVVLAAPDPAAVPETHPAAGKDHGAFVCRGGVCSLPVEDPSALLALLHCT